MPELPDLVVCIERLQALVQGQVLQRVRVLNPFVLRTAVPPIVSAEGRTITGVERLGKRIVHADNNSNHGARCQTGGKLLADRALSRLLKARWPKRVDEL